MKLNQDLYLLKDSQEQEAVVEIVAAPMTSNESDMQTILIQKRLSLITNNAQFPSDEEAMLVEEIEEIIEGKCLQCINSFTKKFILLRDKK